MSLIARKNQYLGVNAHANSWLQVHNLWRSFHTNHITHLTEAINEALPAGYMAVTEHSLQVSRLLPDQDEPETRRPRPDITIFDRQRRDRAIPTLLQPGAGILTPTIQTMDIHESELSATVIYRLADHAMLGKSGTRGEL